MGMYIYLGPFGGHKLVVFFNPPTTFEGVPVKLIVMRKLLKLGFDPLPIIRLGSFFSDPYVPP